MIHQIVFFLHWKRARTRKTKTKTKKVKKSDPYYGDEIKRFKECYKTYFGTIPFLSSHQCLQLSELIEQTPDFFETLDEVLKTLKSIGEFTGKDGQKYKPSVSFLLKDKNYSDLRNGVYDNRAAPDDEDGDEYGKMTEEEKIAYLDSL